MVVRRKALIGWLIDPAAETVSLEERRASGVSAPKVRSALVPVGMTTIYSSGKAAVTSMMECMRPELESRGVICSAFCPGAVQSNIADAAKTRPAG